VILHAPKNGFFFVIDRTNGKFISAKPFTEVNWATGYDKNGRPIETPRPAPGRPSTACPAPSAATTGTPCPSTRRPAWPTSRCRTCRQPGRGQGLALQRQQPGQPQSGTGWNTGMLINSQPPKSKAFGRLVAWDPVKQKEVWRQEYASPWNGGTLTTAGNLVLPAPPTGASPPTAPTRAKSCGRPHRHRHHRPAGHLRGGWPPVRVHRGGLGRRVRADAARHRQAGPRPVYTFALGGTAPLPEARPYALGELISGVKYDPAHIPEGTKLYVSNCVFCHGVPGVDKGGNIPNLGYVPSRDIENLADFVFKAPS
jgi:quinohemoprotein ethanol dehydrogenase